jgi:hypothetical protein
MENPKSLYQKLSDNGLYTKTYEDFVGQYGNPNGQKELYNKLSSNGLYTKSEQEFVGQYWAPEKKNSMESVGQVQKPTILSESTKTSSVSPSVSTAPTKDKLVTSPIGIVGGEWAKGDKEEISATDDLWNTIKGAGVKAFSTLASLPNKAQEAALDMFVSATGMASDFNKLPSADKKQIKNSLSGLLRSGQQVGGTALAGQPRAVEISDKATQFLNKKSEDIYKKTRQEDVNIIDELDKFRQNPNTESIEKILYEGLKTTVESIPNMAIGAVSLPLLGVAAAAGKREEELKETGGNLGIGYLLNAGISGTSEAIFEGTTNKILKKASRAAFGNPAASKAVAEGFVKSIAKDMGEEGVSEGLTTLVQDLSDKITKGEEINYWKLAKNVANSTILGAMSGGGISAGGKSIGAARRYVAGKIMPKDQIEKIDNNTNTIQSLNLEQGEDVDPEVNKIVNQKISDLMAENESIIAQNEDIASKLSADQVKEIFDIDDRLDENYNSAKSIIDDATMDDSAKELLLKDLLDKQNNLKQQKDAIQKQATSKVPIQPEAGTSLQVAEGEPQAEPQVPAEEVKAEEVTQPLLNVDNTSKALEKEIINNTEEVGKINALNIINKAKNIAEKNEYLNCDAFCTKLVNNKSFKSEFDIIPFEFESDENKLGQLESNLQQGDIIAFGEKDNVRHYATYIGDGKVIEVEEWGAKPREYSLDENLKDYGNVANIYRDKKVNTSLELSEAYHKAKEDNSNPELVKSVESLLGGKIQPTEPISPQQKTEQTNALQKGIDAVNKGLKRGRPRKEAIEGGISFMQQTIAYEEADDTTREQMVRDINKEFGVKEKKAPSIKKITAKPAPKKVTVQEMAALKDQIKLEIKAAKGGAKFADDLRKSISAKVKEFITRGKMSVAQQKTLLNGLKGNLLNPVIRERFFDRMEKMFDRIDYKDRLDEANKYRKQIKKLSKSDTLQDSVKNMASNFAKIIPDFTNIDEFLEKAREVYNAVKTPGIKGKVLSLRQAAIIDDVNKFTQKTIEAQEERVKNTLLDQYDYLVEAGLIDKNMSLQDIQNYVMDVESGMKEINLAEESEIRERVGALFNSMAGIVNEITETGNNPLTGEEVELDSYTKSLISNFSKMDLSQLSVQDMYRATEALENYLVNGIIDNMESIYQIYDGALADKTLVDEGIKALDLKRVGLFGRSNIFARTWAVNISPIKSILDLMFRSREIGSKVFNATGLRDIANASSKVKNIIQKIDKAYVDRFGKTKPNGQDFDSAENTYQRGMYAYLRRNRSGTEAQMDAEFKRRKGQVEKTIADLEKTDDKSLIKKVSVYKQLFESIKDAENIEQVEAMIDPINIDAVKWWTSIFETYYPEVKQIAASVYNTVLEDDINYTPDINEKIIEDNVPDVDQKSSYRMSFNYLNSEKSGTLMKNKRKPLPENRVLNFDFDYNNSSALAKMLIDIKTAPYVQKYKGFTQSKSFEKLFPDAKDRNVIKERMNWYVNEVRNKNISTASPRTSEAAKLLRTLSRYGTAKALGSLSALAKQSIPAFINTTVNLANNPSAVTKGVALMANKDAQKFINNSGYGIANRGLESQTAIESADRILENTDVKSIDKISKSIDKVGKFWLNTFLKNGDVFVARSSWMAYYINKLDQMGEDTSNIDWATHELNKEAADYAEDKVNLQQNVSDTDMLGKFLNSKNPGVTIARTLILPFSSFIFNAKDKISTDLTILASNSNKTEKINAAKSLAGTAAEMVAFELLAAYVSNSIITVAYSILGYEEDEEEIQTRIDKNLNMAITRILTDAISPIPNWGDKALVGLTNAVLNYGQQDLDEEERKLLYEYKPQDYKDAILGLIGGVPEIAIKPTREIASTIEMITSDYYVDKYGNEIMLSPEDKDKLKFVLATEILMTTNALPNEVNRINQKVKDKIIKEAR